VERLATGIATTVFVSWIACSMRQRRAQLGELTHRALESSGLSNRSLVVSSECKPRLGRRTLGLPADGLHDGLPVA
jgi:hypothetical protein